MNISWYELDVQVIQPICWLEPETFFDHADDHEKKINGDSYCYMLSGNMVNEVNRENPAEALLAEGTFFDFLIRKSFSS